MDCDDQIWVVKRYDDSYPLAPNMPCIAPLSIRSEIDLIWIPDQAFGVGKRCTYLPGPILRVSRKTHMGLSRERWDLLPQPD